MRSLGLAQNEVRQVWSDNQGLAIAGQRSAGIYLAHGLEEMYFNKKAFPESIFYFRNSLTLSLTHVTVTAKV
jgi:hypothetical protein